MVTTVGQTKDTGYQFGIRRTFPVSVEEAWDFLFSKKGMKIWLGDTHQNLMVKSPYRTSNGVSGVVRVLKPYSHIRLIWKKNDWQNMSTLQIRVIKNNNKATISFHQEKLQDDKQREEMKDHWTKVMKDLKEMI